MCTGGIYSPRIAEDLIPVLFKLGVQERKPMTKIVDSILRPALRERGFDVAEKPPKKKGDYQ